MIPSEFGLQFGRARTIVSARGFTEMSESKGYAEASYIGFGFGVFLGGFVFGAAADVLQLPVHTMLAYCIGAVVGGLAGMVAGRVAAAMLI